MSKSRNKKKSKNKGNQKFQEMLKKQHLEFWATLKKISDCSGATEAFKKIPKNEYKYIEKLRNGNVNAELPAEHKLNKKDQEYIKNYIQQALEIDKITIKEGKPPITLKEYYIAGSALRLYLNATKDTDFPEAKEVKEGHKAFMDIFDTFYAEESLNAVAIFLALFSSNLAGELYYFRVGLSKKHKYKVCFLATKFEGITKHFTINNGKRPAYRMGVPFRHDGVIWNKIKASDFGIKSSFPDMELDVYIQSHAVKRLYERLDPISTPEYYLFSFMSLLEAKIIKYKGKNLIEFYIGEYKVGYFIAEYIDGVILIKTFLLMTNDATPEGDKLHQQTGISIIGKKYFDIDKLKTFISSDLAEDEKLKEIFIKAGCKSLLDSGQTLHKRNIFVEVAASLSKYLNLDENSD